MTNDHKRDTIGQTTPAMSNAFPLALIGLYSASPGCGKSLAANFLRSQQQYKIVSFASPLKLMVMSLFLDCNYNAQEAYDFAYTNKEIVIPELGVSSRHVQRTLGTEWGRDCIGPDIWVNVWKQGTIGHSKVVADDVRFDNEAIAIKDLGGEIWKIERPGCEIDSNHRSDGGLSGFTFDKVIVNDGSLEKFKADIAAAYNSSNAAEIDLKNSRELYA